MNKVKLALLLSVSFMALPTFRSGSENRSFSTSTLVRRALARKATEMYDKFNKKYAAINPQDLVLCMLSF